MVDQNKIPKEKRYQECGPLEKLWRRRYYLLIPFKWIKWKIFTKEKEYDGKTIWRLLIGMAQSDMKWYYTEKEVKLIFKEMKNKK